MSNFLKQGARKAKVKDKKEVKRRTKEVYKILAEMEDVAQEMIKGDVIITEENIDEEASKYTDRVLGGLERFILLGKVTQYYDSVKKDED